MDQNKQLLHCAVNNSPHTEVIVVCPIVFDVAKRPFVTITFSLYTSECDFSGQPHLRSEDRYRHMANDRARPPTVFPVKRKRSHERCLTLEERFVTLCSSSCPYSFKVKNHYKLFDRNVLCNMAFFRRERVLSRSNGKGAPRTPTAPAVFNSPQSPTSTCSPAASPSSPLPPHMYYTPVMDEPLALIKKPRKDHESAEDTAKSTGTSQIQVNPQRRKRNVMLVVSLARWSKLFTPSQPMGRMECFIVIASGHQHIGLSECMYAHTHTGLLPPRACAGPSLSELCDPARFRKKM